MNTGDFLQWHPHAHILAADGAFSDDGTFHPLETWDSDAGEKRIDAGERLARQIEGERARGEDRQPEEQQQDGCFPADHPENPPAAAHRARQRYRLAASNVKDRKLVPSKAFAYERPVRCCFSSTT